MQSLKRITLRDGAVDHYELLIDESTGSVLNLSADQLFHYESFKKAYLTEINKPFTLTEKQWESAIESLIPAEIVLIENLVLVEFKRFIKHATVINSLDQLYFSDDSIYKGSGYIIFYLDNILDNINDQLFSYLPEEELVSILSGHVNGEVIKNRLPMDQGTLFKITPGTTGPGRYKG